MVIQYWHLQALEAECSTNKKKKTNSL